MRFPNAYKGVSRILSAQILNLIGTVVFLISSILMVLSFSGILGTGFAAMADGATAEMEAAAGNSLVQFGVGSILLIAGVVISLIAYIINLVGCHAAGKDEGQFKVAFWFIIIALILSIVSALVQNANLWLYGWLQFVVTIFEVTALEYSVIGVTNLALNVGDEKIATMGRNLRALVTILCFVLLIVHIFRNSLSAFSSVMGVIASLLELVITIIFIVLLSKTKKMLA